MEKLLPHVLSTPRLLLRQWRPQDLDAFAALNADTEVMEHFPAVLSWEESAALQARLSAHIAATGWGLWAVEIPGLAHCIGYCGLKHVPFESFFTPAVEVAWRLARPYWGQGYAWEAATAALAFGFQELGLPEIVAYTIPRNYRSERLMQRLGMVKQGPETFEHPLLSPGHPMRPHVLYRKSQLDATH
ncbi:GNAT family N-acetyltransferase [Hymenobacter cellulosivorans]|uniref:GNAT family N-acetyltransferase n=1 Tax=Hymenobacter cellulosivorans TaxID=2932249 RepID=A0ABY4F5T2_9BACT|nr:GNAT family N-acetyltransferase [Hymenobacter cellulosivorans]UOQ52029.1 GNAT family N-acetyltransferase [Hymenobacter cellulosivorans]